jgi:hypothetical protein
MEGFDPKQESQGLGDTIAKITNFFGIDKVADAVAKLAGAEGCGCNERREMLNQLFPYEGKTRKFKMLKQFHFNGETYFEGQELEVTKNHPLFGMVLILAKDGVIEEI